MTPLYCKGGCDENPFLGGSYVLRSRNLAYDRSVNLFPIMVDRADGKGKDVGMLLGTPGLDLLTTLGIGPVRGGITAYGIAYVVSGSSFYEVDSSFNLTLLGTLSTFSGPVSIINNTTQILISDGVSGYLFTIGGSSISVVASFPAGGLQLSYQDGFGLTFAANTEQWYQSNLNDLGTWDPLNFSSADAKPDNIISMIDVNREVWLINSGSVEVWINAGLPGFAFQRLTGVFPEHGSVATYSALRIGESVFFLSQDKDGQGLVFMSRGYNLVDITDEATAYQFAQYAKMGTISDAIAFSYQQEKHTFYWLIFPTANASWVYDLTTGKWHERSYFFNGNFSRHLANCGFFFNGLNVVGDYRNGNLYALNLDTYTDNGATKKWVRSWRALPPAKQVFEPMSFDSLQIDAQVGIDVPATVAGKPNYLKLPGASGDYASTPDSAVLDITSDIQFIFYAVAADWTPASAQIFLAKYTNPPNFSYRSFVNTNGTIAFGWSEDGTVEKLIASSVAPTIANGSGLWIKITFDANNGAAGSTTTFYTSTDDPSTPLSAIAWTALGTPRISAGASSIFSSSAPLEVGSQTNGTAARFIGKIYSAYVYNGIGGTLAASMVANDTTQGASSWTSLLTGENWAVNGAASIVASRVELNPQVMLRWSDDGGHNWGNERKQAFGKTGETGLRVMFRRLGSTKRGKGLDRIFELSGDDPIPVVLIGADMDADLA